MIRKILIFGLALIISFCLIGCAGGSESPDNTGSDNQNTNTKTNPFPMYRESVFDAEKAEGNDAVLVDTSKGDQGYFGVQVLSEAKMKLQVKKEDREEAYVYDLVNNKTDFFPFQVGDGNYEVRIMQNAEENKYFEVYSITVPVKLENEFVPFLVACQYADYNRDSLCVKKADELAEGSSDEKDFITKVFQYVSDNVTYDSEKASVVQTGYIPDPDETFSTNKGICFDYASLTASMLRSQGIPTKIIFGYVAPDNIYHAWNMFYTEEAGWTTVEFKADPNQWNRLDLTFIANGADSSFIGDGTNYTDIYQY